MNPGMNRTNLADKICEIYSFVDSKGVKQRAGCLKSLRELEARGEFRLPEAEQRGGTGKNPRRLEEAVPDAEGVPGAAGEVEGLRLVYVQRQEEMRIWNEMMIREHLLEAGPLVGRQVRYLIGSEYGWLGGLGFGAAALHLRDRDLWIGWDLETRRKYLDRVVGLSRFLIRPSVRCHNLASRVLGMSMEEFPRDFERRYGFRPWLVETFVDTSQFSGTSFRAANWELVGQTQGRGRQDRGHVRHAKTIKDIYVYRLKKTFRMEMGVSSEYRYEEKRGSLETREGVETEQWAESEFGDAPLGDERLSRRLVASAAEMGKQPGRPFSAALKGDWPSVKGYYRLIEKPDDSEVTMENILQPHRERTMSRMKAEETVLCIQDGTDLDYSGMVECEGLGPIGSNQTGTKSKGLHLHTTMAITTKGVPLGILKEECDAPQWRLDQGDDRHRNSVPIEEKKSFLWIKGLRDCMQVAKEMTQTKIVCVMDREADNFEVFHEQRETPAVHVLVRAKHDRCTTEDVKLFEAVRKTQVRSRLRVNVQRQSARPKKGNRKELPKRPGREAELCVRYRRIEFRNGLHKDKEAIAVWVIHVLEENTPAGVEAIEWFLLTTVDISSAEDAERCIKWYCLRWRIEDWHRVLKSGCKIEDIAHRTADRLKRAIAINSVIAWRIMLMTLLGRETPDLPAEVLFSDIEIEVLNSFAKKKA